MNEDAGASGPSGAGQALLLQTISNLRSGLAALDQLGFQDAAILVDHAVDIVEPCHPDVAAGLHGSRPLPEHLQRLLDEAEADELTETAVGDAMRPRNLSVETSCL